MNIFILKYNNYYNRILKKYDNMNDYINNHDYTAIEKMNFNPNDGVDAELTINWNESWTPDYLIAVEPYTGTMQRWFIIDFIRLRGRQYNAILHRDLIADNYDELLDSDCFIEKAILSSDNPLIYNKENTTVNQIKTNEWTLKDATNCAWIVGYYGKKYLETEVKMSASYKDKLNYDYTITSTFEDWYNAYSVDYITNFELIASLTSIPLAGVIGVDPSIYKFSFNENNLISSEKIDKNKFADAQSYINKLTNKSVSSPVLSNANTMLSRNEYPTLNKVWSMINPNKNAIISSLKNFQGNFLTNTEYNNNVKKFNNKLVRFLDSNGNEKFYKILIEEKLTPTKQYTRTYVSTSHYPDDLYDSINSKNLSDIFYNSINSGKTNVYIVGAEHNSFIIHAIEIKRGQYSAEINSGKNELLDSPYGMFIIPYSPEGNITIYNTGSDIGTITQSSNISFNIANAFSVNYSGANQIYDIQILPYCPITDIIDENGNINLKNRTESYDVIKYTDPNNKESVVGYILYPTVSSFTLEIPFNFNVENTKISNETEMLRLCSPNFNGQFEFIPAQNNGVNSFNVDCTYKPYQPYIHINPDFNPNGLYGKDFNDARGLICGGDFSITQITDAWNTYEIQNKNYNNVFKRDIDNMEVQHKWERISDISAATSSAIASGAALSLINPVAGVLGGMASAGAGAIDIYAKEQLRQEALDYKKDMFGYQLGNIRALPQSISRTSGFTYNNKFFPILEYYTCKEEEKVAIANKIAYNSMTVMAIGKLNDYIGVQWSYNDITSKGYIKASLIRSNIDSDFKLINSLSDELYKGVYIQ